MAAKLTYQIPSSNFETIRNQIASVIKLELDNQAALRGVGNPIVPNPDYTAEIYVERFTPVDKSEGNVIIISVENCRFNNQTPISQSNETLYSIDIYCNGIETLDIEGYKTSSIKLQRLCGLIRHILMSPYYDRLGLANGIIEHREVSQIRFARVNDEQDSVFSRMARMDVSVKMNENQNGIDPIIAGGYDTIIKIELTEKGYKLTYNN
jgi:hypothetical protein